MASLTAFGVFVARPRSAGGSVNIRIGILRFRCWLALADRRYLRENGRMRPGNQSNKRMRGRGRKGPNPLTRTFESNGPDVKIRGTAQHIAEKYLQLARDAQASGDRVMGENYLQHAEHYLRIIAAAQPAQVQHSRHDAEDGADGPVNGPGMGGERQRHDRQGGGNSEYVEEDSPQPFIESMPTIDASGQVNRAAEPDHDEGDTDVSEDDAEKPRRRARVARGRPRKVSSDADEGAAASEGAEAAADAGDEDAPKTRARRTPRPRRVKKADEALEVEGAPAGE